MRTDALRPIERLRRSADEAKRTNKKWSLTLEDYTQEISQGCFYCGKGLLNHVGTCLDRIDNSKGYTLDNVLPCCGICNQTRNEHWSVEETQAMILEGLKIRRQNETVI